MKVIGYYELRRMPPGTVFRRLTQDGFPWDGLNVITRADADADLLFEDHWFHCYDQLECGDQAPAEEGDERDSEFDYDARYLVIDPQELRDFMDAVHEAGALNQTNA